MAGKIVLISGLTGLIGSHVALRYLKEGWTIRGTVRSTDKGEAWKALYPQFADRIQLAIIPDITAPGAFDEAIKGVTIFCHVATVVPELDGQGTPELNQLLIDTPYKGTMLALETAMKEPSVKTVVLTSSNAAIMTFTGDGYNGKTFSEETWNPATLEDALATSDPMVSYAYGKTNAERAAWAFVEREKPHFGVVQILPSFVYGEPAGVPGPKGKPMLGTNVLLKPLLTEPAADMNKLIGGPDTCDVRDVAWAHYAAGINPAAAGKRFVICHPELNYMSKYLKFFKETYTEYANKMPTLPENFVEPDDYFCDGSRISRELGLKYHSFEDTAKFAGDWLIKVLY